MRRTRWLAVILPLAFAVSGCQIEKGPPNPLPANSEESIFVLVPPKYDTKLTPGENQCVFLVFLFPKANPGGNAVVSCTGAPMANDDSLLHVTLREDNSIWINNSEPAGNVTDTSTLTQKLETLFEDRSRNRVFEEGSNRIAKAVGVRVPESFTYGELIIVATAVKKSGADPIVLLLDDHLPYQPILNKRASR